MSEVLIRTYRAELHVSNGDGRTLHGLCVPYNVPAKQVAVGIDGPPGSVYEEAFQHGAFARNMKAPQRVLLRFEHRDGLLDIAGHGERLEERDEGLWGSFRALETPTGDQALALHRAGVLAYFSVGFRPLGNGRRRNGVVYRTHCHLDEVSLCREAAYPGTDVAVRDKPAITLERPAVDAELERRLSALGFQRVPVT